MPRTHWEGGKGLPCDGQPEQEAVVSRDCFFGLAGQHGVLRMQATTSQPFRVCVVTCRWQPCTHMPKNMRLHTHTHAHPPPEAYPRVIRAPY